MIEEEKKDIQQGRKGAGWEGRKEMVGHAYIFRTRWRRKGQKFTVILGYIAS